MGIHISRLLDVASCVSTGCAVKSRQCPQFNEMRKTNEVPATVILCSHLLFVDRDVCSRAGAARKRRPYPPARTAEGFRQPNRSSEAIQQFSGNAGSES